MKNLAVILLITLVVMCCSQTKEKDTKTLEVESVNENPEADGFNLEASDKKAIAIADKVMEAMGGRKAWDNTNYLSWNFFDYRKHVWDKSTGMARVENLRDDLKVIVNVNASELNGKVFKDGQEMTDPDSLAKYLQYGKSAWINDAYWIVMPFKLKDSGVTLTYVGEDTTALGVMSDVIRMTFQNVGDTPENAYNVWVAKESNLVMQWAYYEKSDQEEANWTIPWDNYNTFGEIRLADNRGRNKITEITVMESVPENMFTSFE